MNMLSTCFLSIHVYSKVLVIFKMWLVSVFACIQMTIWLVLCVAPKLSEFKPKFSQEVGTKWKIFCSPQVGDRPFRFEWRKNSQPLLTGAHHRIETSEDDSLLIIDKLLASDSANYSCFVKNQDGLDSQTTLLVIKGFHI